jgi:hypothetical protein
MLTPNSPARLHLIHIAVNLERNAMHMFKRLMTTDQRREDDNIFFYDEMDQIELWFKIHKFWGSR